MGQAAFAQPPQSFLELQFAELQERYPGATLQSTNEFSVISVPGVAVPPGWNKTETAIHFIVPPGYPHANPDCFNADAELRLANGCKPKNAEVQPMPLIGETLWFSWHLQRPWQPSRDSLLTWLAVI